MPAPDALNARIDALEELVVELGQREGAQGKAGVAGEVGPALRNQYRRIARWITTCWIAS